MPCTKKIKRSARGFSLLELLIASTLALIVGSILVSSLFMNMSAQRITQGYNQNTRSANDALQRIVYGFGGNRGLREAAEVTVVNSSPGWRITFEDGSYITYLPGVGRIENQAGIVYVKNVRDSYVRQNLNTVGITIGITVESKNLKRSLLQTVETSIVYRNALFD
ncbi:MAG: prepilin-type N-terminal cleavage/methylation domain-containing protein [Kiritimatiellia bacterium]|jgi:prepilin-type N-terminal cleavage/methylation domain-containing protein